MKFASYGATLETGDLIGGDVELPEDIDRLDQSILSPSPPGCSGLVD